MKISNYLFSLLATFLLYSTTVSAQTLGISIGEADYDGALDDTSITLSAVFPLNESFALEVSYNDLGDVSFYAYEYDVKVDASSFDVLMVGLAPLNDKVNAFGKVGFSKWELDSRFYQGSDVRYVKVDGTDLTIAAGLEMALNDKVSGNIQWQKTHELDIDKISLGLSFDL